jgi:hypothetical protein
MQLSLFFERAWMSLFSFVTLIPPLESGGYLSLTFLKFSTGL